MPDWADQQAKKFIDLLGTGPAVSRETAASALAAILRTAEAGGALRGSREAMAIVEMTFRGETSTTRLQ